MLERKVEGNPEGKTVSSMPSLKGRVVQTTTVSGWIYDENGIKCMSFPLTP